jgi:OmcA/MtrC family decaheme c-type cytochrome
MRKLVFVVLAMVACEGPPGPQGTTGDPGSDGSDGTNGDAGSPGEAGVGPWLTQPALSIAVTDLAFAGTTATVSFTLTDGHGAPLDTTGRLTAGTVAPSFVLAQLAVAGDGSPLQYTAYTTQQVTAGTTTATQASTESSGTLDTVDVTAGTYRYTFAAPTTGLDPTLTQTVGALAVRTTDIGQVIASSTFSARPDGGTPVARQDVTDATCNSCHRALSMHGGRWTSTDECILCHQPQSSDPFTGNTLDFKVMIHKIHDGAKLPSVVAGTPYQIVGYGQSTNDFSSVEFPQNIQRCAACHAGAQATRWQTAPAKAACTSCHDTTSFVQPVPAGMVLHSGGPQVDDSPCAVCHPSSGGLAGIADNHLTGLLSPTAPSVVLAIQSITSTAPGQTPTMLFTASVNGQPVSLLAQPLTSLTATIAGPTTDYQNEWQAKIQGASGAVGTLALVDATTGLHSYTFPATAAIPPTATGSYSVGLEGYLQPTPSDARYAAINPVLAFAVTDSTAVPRRSIVSRDNCNGCHYSVSAHGGSRNNPDYCVFCHNPASYDSAGAPRFQTTSNVVVEALDFRHMLHKVHRGEQLTQPYVLGGFPLPTVANPGGTPNDFTDIRYPRALTDCNACHAGKTWTLPMTASPAYAPTTSGVMACAAAGGSNPTAYCPSPFWTVTSTSQIQPQTSVCTSCHDAPYTLAHAELNTTPAGVEACATCHGPGMAYDVEVFHKP